MLIGGALPENAGKAREVSPITYITPNNPPMLAIYGTADRTVPHDKAVRLDKALTLAGVLNYFISVIGAGHGGFSDEAVDRAGAFFSKVLLGKDMEISTEQLEKPELY